MKNLIELPAWQALNRHYQEIVANHMRDAFASDDTRFDKFSIKHGEILLDYSRNRINEETVRLLLNLAESVDLKAKIADLFAGNPINITEKRPALHTALRNISGKPVYINDENISSRIDAARSHLFQFADDIHTAKRTGITGKPFQHIVNIGIGGSHLGPMMCTEALKDYAVSDLKFHFVSTIDPDHLRDVLHLVDPDTTLFIVSSKTFTTIETLTNARSARDWLSSQLGQDAPINHMIAVTANKENALNFGITEENIFTFWDWVGGRYSIWSAIGLPLILLIGTKQFSEFLAGAYDIDQHFQKSAYRHNIPVMLGMLSIWYSNFFNTAAQAIIPYSHRLRHLVSYIQQMEMESSGKSTTLTGDRVSYTTGSIIFGEEGCNGQHTFNQLLHQGQHMIPVDFILIAKPHQDASLQHHDVLLASALSQAYALMHGKPAADDMNNQHLAIDGNKPSNIMMLDRLNPRNLGALLAIYEHKTFVQSAVWNINPFDQWGVELGKKTLPTVLEQMNETKQHRHLDKSTLSLIAHFKKLKDKS